MNLRSQINEIVKEYFGREKIYTQVCEVVSVDVTTRTCQVDPVNGDAERKGRLQASLSLSEGLYIKPTVGSKVTLTFINNLTGIITQFSEIDKIHLKTENKIKIENDTEDLKTIINDLIGEIKLITVPTPSGTSGVPLNVADFTAINNRINNLLE